MIRFLSSHKASVAVEFALIAPIFIFLICISIESFRIQMARCLVERSIYDLAYRSKVDQDRNSNFQSLAQSVIEKRSNNFFQVNEVTVEVFHAENFADIINNPIVGPGGSSDIALIKFTTSFGLFKNLFLKPMKLDKETFMYYYINEAAGKSS